LTGAALALLVGSALWVAPTTANEPERTADRPPGSSRYAMNPVEGGFLRMDTDTGIVSLCARRQSGWSCETVPDDYQAVRKDLDRMARENSDLRRQVEDLKRGGTGEVEARRERRLQLPSDEEVDQALSYLDRMLRKFKGFIEKHQGPGADRTMQRS
jgi:hypothetical protein